MAIDFTFPEEVENARLVIRQFMQDTVRPKMEELRAQRGAGREAWRGAIDELRQAARDKGVW
ncbi:MAG: hypothetical protein P8Y95_03110, partial [Gammaproteobacteria bacterium]